MVDNIHLDLVPIRISTTIRVPAEMEKRIKIFMRMGFYSSVARFALESMRNTMIHMTANLKKIRPEIEKRYETESDKLLAESSALKKIYLEGWIERVSEYKPLKQINLNLASDFYDMFIHMMTTYLGLKELQTMVILCMSYDLARITSYIQMGFDLGVGVPGISSKQNVPTDKDVDDILEKSGVVKQKPSELPDDINQE